MGTAYDRFCEFLVSEGGPTATEYGVLIAIICIAVIGAMSAFGDHMNSIYTAVTNTIPQG